MRDGLHLSAALDCPLFIRYEILSHLECRLTLRRLMAVNRTFHRLLQPTDSPALEIWARSWLEVNERD